MATVIVYELAGLFLGDTEPGCWSYAAEPHHLPIGGWLAQGALQEIIAPIEVAADSYEAKSAFENSDRWEINNAVSNGLLD